MGIFRRVSDILSANLNDLVERWEDPEKMLRLAIREMEAAIEESMEGAARAIASEKLLVKELAHHQRRAEEELKAAEKAIRGEDPAKAWKALVQKREHLDLVRTLERELESAAAATQAIHRRIEAMRRKLAEARRKISLLSARKRVAHARRCLGPEGTGRSRGGGGSRAFARFERMEEQINRVEAGPTRTSWGPWPGCESWSRRSTWPSSPAPPPPGPRSW